MSSIVNKIKDAVQDKTHSGSGSNNNNNDSSYSGNNNNNSGLGSSNDNYDSTNPRTSNVPQSQQQPGQSGVGRTTRSSAAGGAGGAGGYGNDAYAADTAAAGGAGGVSGAGVGSGFGRDSGLGGGSSGYGNDSSGFGRDTQTGAGGAGGVGGLGGGVNSGVGNDYATGAGNDATYGGAGVGGTGSRATGPGLDQRAAGGVSGSSGLRDTTGVRSGAGGDEFGAIGGRADEFGTQAKNQYGSAAQQAGDVYDNSGLGGNTRNLQGSGRGGYTDGSTGGNFPAGGSRDPTDAAQVPPSVLAKHLGDPVQNHEDHGHDRVRRNSAATHQESFRGI